MSIGKPRLMKTRSFDHINGHIKSSPVLCS